MTRNRALELDEVRDAVKPCPKPAPKVKKAKNPPIDKAAILLKRYGETARTPECDCGCGQDGHDLHHCFIGRRKGYPILDDERNLVLVNHNEHIAGDFDNLEMRKWFWNHQCGRFTEKAMLEWIDAVLAAGLDRSRIDWL